MNIIQIRKELPTSVLTHEMLEDILSPHVNNVNAKISYMVKKGELVRLKKGFYVLGEEYRTTPLDRFSYKSIPLQAYALGIDWLYDKTHGGKLIATAEKALCDKIKFDRGIGRLSQSKLETYLAHDLRIDMEMLFNLDAECIAAIASAYRSFNLENLAKLIRRRRHNALNS